MEYKGHEYKIFFCDPSKNWGDAKGLFGIESPAGSTGNYYPTYREAEEAAKAKIDRHVAHIPQTDEQWIEAVENCLVWTDYEQCHMDEAMVLELLKKAKLHF